MLSFQSCSCDEPGLRRIVLAAVAELGSCRVYLCTMGFWPMDNMLLPRFVERHEEEQALRLLKLTPCPHCAREGFLNRHGFPVW